MARYVDDVVAKQRQLSFLIDAVQIEVSSFGRAAYFEAIVARAPVIRIKFFPLRLDNS